MAFGERTLYFIIEHPMRGVLKEDPNPETGKPSFSPVQGRADERNARYFALRRAIQDLQELSLPTGCQIRASQWEGTVRPGDHDWRGSTYYYDGEAWYNESGEVRVSPELAARLTREFAIDGMNDAWPVAWPVPPAGI